MLAPSQIIEGGGGGAGPPLPTPMCMSKEMSCPSIKVVV